MKRFKRSLEGFAAALFVLVLVIGQIAIVPPASAVMTEGSDETYFYANRDTACSIWADPSMRGTVPDMIAAIRMAETAEYQGVLRWDHTLNCARRKEGLWIELFCAWKGGLEGNDDLPEILSDQWHCLWEITYDIHMGGP